ncbi:AbrB/MazE/SpoVT family DNA-binding domain-containing protein [Desulfobotulus mexicanus]|uniref:AbrB/MazE/SpoVT family DNA-binding domain-containing protein n=1 Tax=Desulfobotulus mexicanus TaxID=2586642 RepID=A0A5S5MFK5_9BACT|nr:AbrB/MazE/SpoVT family DNA-binding domain-containing protein [Desulfobotulus mexicanus]TYT74415.1 AbrB/MazE/SpoVT family DNA-binding domain-containing protein [Desulfobotulus mexicanus]
MRTQVRKIGNSLGSIIPASLIRQLNLREGSEIDMKEDGGRIILEPVKGSQKPFPFSEKVLLKGLDAHTAHADELAAVSEKEMGC